MAHKKDKNSLQLERTALAPVNPCAQNTAPLSSLLDSGLDDIKVPSLQPLSPIKTPSVVRITIQKDPTQRATSLLIDQHVDNLSIPVLEPQRVSPRSNSTTTITQVRPPWLTLLVPWDGTIKWAIRGSSVFETTDEELDALLYRPNIVSKESPTELWMFQFGLRYIPAEGDRDVHRAVTIENLPSDVTLQQLLPLITGEIYSAHFLDTVSITGSNTAFIVFVTQADTVDFLKNSGGSLALRATQAKVTLVPTPTYPMAASMARLVFKEGHTRCVCISGVRDTLKGEIRRVLGRSPFLEYLERIEDGQVLGDVYARFHSIKGATAAYKLLKSHPSFQKCKLRFLAARPLARQPRIGIWD
ncbi:hypothetical protein BO85DRAFT_413118 [Aspergillus piperis CBS 112811]|uniref:RRM domain-containing protein n=1 Tax=Aspergillus piperis CBS 112811 TaxID=1448313 RepID=A0A8G1RA70_9EURO|nr:hypothetical protein BO85DRAFT_413118 [Aspergillus piperis CBS 112811]RAH62133.1 hypothetical protein BO85DRAFT_413118 [Aspergillus piperis CBS 112811]